jgi:hypothetical protein
MVESSPVLVWLCPTTTLQIFLKKMIFIESQIVIPFFVVKKWNINLSMNKLIANYMQQVSNIYVILT